MFLCCRIFTPFAGEERLMGILYVAGKLEELLILTGQERQWPIQRPELFLQPRSFSLTARRPIGVNPIAYSYREASTKEARQETHDVVPLVHCDRLLKKLDTGTRRV
jgi:hypothetical protein